MSILMFILILSIILVDFWMLIFLHTALKRGYITHNYILNMTTVRSLWDHDTWHIIKQYSVLVYRWVSTDRCSVLYKFMGFTKQTCTADPHEHSRGKRSGGWHRVNDHWCFVPSQWGSCASLINLLYPRHPVHLSMWMRWLCNWSNFNAINMK